MDYTQLKQQWQANRSAILASKLEKLITKKGLGLPESVKAGRVGFVGSFTLNNIASSFRMGSLFDMDVNTEIFLGEYNQYAQEILNPQSPLYEFGPEITYLLLDGRNVMGAAFDCGTATVQQMIDIVDSQCELFAQLIQAFQNQDAGMLVVHTIPEPAYDVWGIQAEKPGSVTWAIRQINSHIRKCAEESASCMVLDSDRIEARLGLEAGHDEKMRHLGKFCYSQAGALAVADEQLRYWRALKGKMRKCIVLDLDNTLWGGIVGEDGIENLALGSHGAGSAYQEFQRTLLGFFNRGVILAVNSRNNWDDAMEVIQSHPEQVLREEHFGAIRINWQDKASNILEIARELNIGLDSLVFFDDDKHNRELVRQQLPQVLVPDFPEDPSYLTRALLSISQFDTLSITVEDRKRGQMYAAERGRREMKDGAGGNLDEFLATLETKVKVQPADKFSIPRIAQLTQKTNQFNMTTRRYSPADIEQMVADPAKRVYCMSVSDKFGDSGIVGVAIVNAEKKVWTLDTFLMSCRVLGRRVEEGFLCWIAEQAREQGVLEIRGRVIFTPKNPPARELFSKMGFKLHDRLVDGTIWVGKLNEVMLECPDTFEFI